MVNTVIEETPYFTTLLIHNVITVLEKTARRRFNTGQVITLFSQHRGIKVVRKQGLESEAWDVFVLIEFPEEVVQMLHKDKTLEETFEEQLKQSFSAAIEAMPFFDPLPRVLVAVWILLDWQERLANLAQKIDRSEDVSESEDVQNLGFLSNQGINVPTAVEWETFILGSPPEADIAKALDRAGVLFTTNSPMRLGGVTHRKKLYPDFVVCNNGKWGILEVDGLAYHLPENKAQEDSRNELFHQHGISVIRHYQAKECTKDPDGVVKRFLDQLNRFG